MSFAFLEPRSIPELLEMLERSGPGAKLLAGGTDIGVLLRRQKIAPTHLISLARIPELCRLAVVDGEVVIGAGVLHREVEKSPLFQDALLALPEACATVGSVQIRNAGTVGGNLCNASPAADTPPVLLALGASVTVVGVKGATRMPLERFFLGYRKTALGPTDILFDIRVPIPAARTGSAFLKMGRRKAMEISIACVAAAVRLDEAGRCQDVKIGLGSVAPVSLRALQAEREVLGQVPTPERLARAGVAAAEECSPIDDLRATGEYRRMVVSTLVPRALELAIQRAGVYGPDQTGVAG